MGLLLNRSEGDAFRIGDDITVRVVNIDGRRVTVNIDAPRELNIRRLDRDKKERNYDEYPYANDKEREAAKEILDLLYEVVEGRWRKN